MNVFVKRIILHIMQKFICLIAAAIFSAQAYADAQCVPFNNLYAPTTHCYWGRFAGNPYEHEEVVDKGSISPEFSHHTVNLIQGTDPRTGNGLQIIPPGESWSIRLGNWLDGFYSPYFIGHRYNCGEAEAIMYDLVPDSAAPIVMVKFAPIFEEPNHNDDMQPKIIIELLDDNGNRLNNDGCGYMEFKYFDAGSTWGDSYWLAQTMKRKTKSPYNSYFVNENHHIKWHDWITVPISLYNYIGQSIHLRITAGDCGFTDHFGYAYIHVKCVENLQSVPGCGDSNTDVTFTAPEGFVYNWYKLVNNIRTDLISGNRTITVKANGQEYECEAASPDVTACSFTMRVNARPRLPKASFTIRKIPGCVDTFYLTNNSSVTSDGYLAYVPQEDVDSVYWDFGDGRTSTAYDISSIPLVYDHKGNYTITLRARLTNGGCEDIMTKTVHAHGAEDIHERHLYDTICGGMIRIFDNQQLTRSGLYIQHTPTSNGCDSLTYLHLTVWDSYLIKDTVDICDGESYTFHQNGHERILRRHGLYTDSLKTIHGCDSVYQLLLRVHPKYYTLIRDTICQGERYQFHKHGAPYYYDSTGVYMDSLLSVWGCDSVFCLDLFVKPVYKFTDYRHTCAGKPFLYHGRTYNVSGIYNVHYNTILGCDSVYQLHLTFDPVYKIDTFCTVSDQQLPFTWHGRTYNRAGTFDDTLSSHEGCDSIIRLHLKVGLVYNFIDPDVVMCEGSVYQFHDTLIRTGGDYMRRFRTIDGFDSTYTVHVTVKPRYRTQIRATIVEGQSYPFLNGINLTNSGVYTYTYGENETRCDSVIELTLTVHSKYLIPEQVTICRGDSLAYHKNGRTVYYKEARIYYDSLKTVYGFDSVYVLTLRVLPYYLKTDMKTLCQSELDDYRWHDRAFTNSGIYYDSLKTLTVPQCDSIWQLKLTVNPEYIKYDSVASICEGESFYFGHRQLTAPGIYYDSLKTVGCNCDSIIRLTLTLNDTYYIDTVAQLCQGDTMLWYGRRLGTSGDYYHTRQTIKGCDSTVHLSLRVHASYTYPVEKIRIGEGQTYTWHDAAYRNTGIYTAGGTTIHGCDSIYTLELEVLPRRIEHIIDTICTGERYNFRHKYILHRGGDYYDTVRYNATGFDSVIYHLELHEYEPFYRLETRQICQGDSLSWHGRRLNNSGIYFDNHTNNKGCDSIYELRLTVNPSPVTNLAVKICSNETPYYFTRKGVDLPLYASGYYSDTLHTQGYGCDSIVNLYLTVGQAYDIWIDSTICEGDYMMFGGRQLTEGGRYVFRGQSRSGCDSTVTLNLIVNPMARLTLNHNRCVGDTYNFNGRALTQSGQYIDTLQSVITHCDSIVTLNLRMHEPYLHEIYATTCANNPYMFNGVQYTSSQTLTWNGKRVGTDCDSVEIVHLTVNSVYQKDTTIHMCSGNQVILFGHTYQHGGEFVDTLVTHDGCDSIYHIHLIEHPTAFIQEYHMLCQWEQFVWTGHKNDTVLTHAGVYYDYLTNVAGCDSIHKLTLTMLPSYHINEEMRTCSNVPILWHGNTYSTSGIYYDSLRSLTTGCDSIYSLTLTVDPAYTITLMDTICEGEHVIFDGRSLTEGGYYTSRMHSINGCDSITHLLLTKHKTKRVYRNADLCEGETFHFHGNVFTKGGMYIDTTTLATGCDSITTWHVSFHHSVRDTLYDTICSSVRNYSFHGSVFRTPGFHEISAQSQFGCDSSYVLHLTIAPCYETHIDTSICLGDYLTINGKIYQRAGIFYDTLRTINHACDSVFIIRISENRPYNFTNSVTLCRDELPYTWQGHNRTVTHSGIYYDSCRTVNRCDSVYELKVYVNNSFYHEDYVTINDKMWYNFNGRMLNQSGVYYDSLISLVSRCDSVYKLTLTVNPTYSDVRYEHICEGDGYIFGKYEPRTLYTSGRYVDSLKTIHGQDSIDILELTVYKPIVLDTVVHICDKQLPYNWHGHNYNVQGTYDETGTSVLTGCDSTNRLHLFVHPTYRIEENRTVCDGEHIMWHNRYLTSGGTYVDSLRTLTWGYDSIHVLHFQVNPTYLFEQRAEICDGEYYDYNHRRYTSSGTYTDSLRTASCNCDSIYRLTLVVKPTDLHTTTASICKGETYEWLGRQLTQTGVYDSISTNIYGCDSVNRLKLTVNPIFHQIVTDTICQGEYFRLNGKVYNQPLTIDSATSQVTGCDSIWEIHLTILPSPREQVYDTICEGEQFIMGGRTYTRPGMYRDTTLTVDGCTSIRTLYLTVNPTSYHKEILHLCRGDEYIRPASGAHETTAGLYRDTLHSIYGCDSVIEAQVIYHDPILDTVRATVCSNQPFYFYGRTYNTSGTFNIPETDGRTIFGCDSIHTLILTINPAYVFPTENRVDICAGDYVEFNGRRISETGTYRDTVLTQESHCDSVIQMRVVKHQTYMFNESAAICRGDSVEWHHNGTIVYLTETGTYYDSLVTVGAPYCDSIYVLQMRVDEPYVFKDTLTICESSYQNFFGQLLRTAGDYTYVRPGRTCDSTYMLHLNVTKHDTVYMYMTICDGEEVDFAGNTLTRGGVYRTTESSVLNYCDSTTILYLTVHPIRRRTIETHIQQGDSVRWHLNGQEIYCHTTGIYFDTLQSVDGCDSITTLHLIVHRVVHDSIVASVCKGDSYTFAGMPLYNAGIYRDTIVSMYGIDSIIRTLNLRVLPTYMRDTTVRLCEGDYFSYNGHLYNQPGYYVDTALTDEGCDSILRLRLSVLYVRRYEQVASICDGDVYSWHGMDCTAAQAIYRDTIRSAVDNCDSIIYTLRLRATPTFYDEDVIVSCSSYRWHGRVYTQSGIYYDSLRNQYNCDSVYCLRLTINPSSTATIYDTICEGEFYHFGDQALTRSGIYFDTTMMATGCDSITTLRLHVRPSYFIRQNPIHLCEGDSVPFGGKWISATGTYTDSLLSINGCDSVVQRKIFVHPHQIREWYDTICEGEIYHFMDQYVSDAGLYELHIPNSYGCDSISYILHLIVMPNYTHTVYTRICNGDYVMFGYEEVSAPGTYTYTYKSIFGCDSTVTMHLTLNQTYTQTTYSTICRGDSVEWHHQGHTIYLRETGIYPDTLKTTAGCDSIVKLSLSVMPSPLITNIHIHDICADDEQWSMQVFFNGMRPLKFSIIFDEHAHQAGFRDILDEEYTDILTGPLPKAAETSYLRPDYYRGLLILGDHACELDTASRAEIELLVRYPSWIIEQNWNDVIAVLNEHYNGGYIFSGFDWYVNDNQIDGESRSYLYMPGHIRTNDKVHVAPTRQGETYAIPSCPIEIEDRTGKDVYSFPVVCTPTLMPAEFKLRAKTDGTYILYDAVGHRLQNGSYAGGEEMLLSVPKISGVYLLNLKTADGQSQTEKLIVP